MTAERVSLYVMRHGKSDWDADFPSDHERPLKRRGREAAARVGAALARLGEAPDLVLSSTAERAQRTAQLAHEAGEFDCEVRTLRELYGASPARVIELVREHARGARRVLTVGHEPTCSALVARLTGSPQLEFPTAAIARIDIAGGGFEGLEFGAGALLWLATPKRPGPLGGEALTG